VTEVPEHLLQRSRDRRAALGLGGGGEGAAPAASSASEDAGTDVEASAGAPAPAAPAAAAPAEVEAKPPEPVPPYVEAALQRKRIPYWAMPIVGLLPIWAILYAGSLSPADTGGPSQLDLGAEVYAARCASCHGGGGGGGVGRQLSDGEVLKTFPNIADQLAFVAHGSDGAGLGNSYGDPNREGGPHIAGSFNGNKMPAFLETLTPEELLAVVRPATTRHGCGRTATRSSRRTAPSCSRPTASRCSIPRPATCSSPVRLAEFAVPGER
jgi:mono/diheme cytochrome c family protein